MFRHGVRNVPDIGESAAVRPDAGTGAAGRSKLTLDERIPTRENLLFSWHIGKRATRRSWACQREHWVRQQAQTKRRTVDGRTGQMFLE